jgi:hypothetical protein
MNVNGMSVCQIQERLVGKVVVFTKDYERNEINFSPKMKAEIVAFRVYKRDMFVLCFDFKKFEEHNKQFSVPKYNDINGKPTLHWHETKYYPSNGIENHYFISNEELPFYLEEDVIQDIEDCSDKEKIDYLLKEVEALKKEIEDLKKKH